MQTHIEQGDFQADKHKPGFFDDLRTILPEEHARTRHVERQIFAEHKNLLGMKAIEVKARYVEYTQSLKTYGVKFFLVKETLPSKRKLVPRLLGFTRDAIIRVDVVTKEVLKTWPLTTVSRWASSKDNFILDFGGFEATYYSVLTDQAEQLSQHLAERLQGSLKQKQQQEARAASSAPTADPLMVIT